MFVSLIPWTILQGYKLTKNNVENVGREYEPQAGSDGLLAETQEYHKIATWKLDSSTTLGDELN